jgi:putative membrane protein
MKFLAGSLLDALRGFLIGLAEIVPGVSGGTIALIVGVYQTLIRSAANLVEAVLSALRFNPRACVDSWKKVSWSVVLPVVAGMVGGIFGGAWLLQPVLEEYPLHTRAVFAGLILASLWVPIRSVGSAWTPRLVLGALAASAVTFLVVGLPELSQSSGSLWWVAPAAAVAVCALVLPGVSGSYLLVALGMYQPTLSAVNDRDFLYLGVFILGAIVGLGLFVRVLQWLLLNHGALTLSLMTGLMLGSLRALWPWQGDDRALLTPGDDVLGMVGLGAAGFLTVVALIIAQEVLTKTRPSHT